MFPTKATETSLNVREHLRIHMSVDLRVIVATSLNDVKCTLSQSERRSERRIPLTYDSVVFTAASTDV